MQYKKNLAFASDSYLKALGLRRDNIGQILTKDNLLVCGYSGRVHTKFLIPKSWMDPRTEKNVTHWIDREQTKQSYVDLMDEVAELGGRAALRYAKRKLGSKFSFVQKIVKLFL